MDIASSAFKSLRTLNGMNTAKITGILMIFVGVFFLMQADEFKEKLYVLGMVAAILGGLWILYAAALAISLIKEKGGIVNFYKWEMTQLNDYLLLTSVKMMWQLLLLLGVGFVFFADKYETLSKAKRDRIRTLGYFAIGISACYFIANAVIGLKFLKK